MEKAEFRIQGQFSPQVDGRSDSPGNDGPLPGWNGHARITGPCGDTMEFWLLVKNSMVIKVAFETDGCGSSQACGSMASCLAEGATMVEALRVRQRDILEALGAFPKESEHCALLAATTLRAACDDYRLHGSWRTV